MKQSIHQEYLTVKNMHLKTTPNIYETKTDKTEGRSSSIVVLQTYTPYFQLLVVLLSRR